MDILSIQPHSIKVELKNPATGAGLGIFIECVSLEDDRVKAVERNLKNKTLRSGRNSVTAEKLEADTITLLSAAIVGWTWAEGITLGSLDNPPYNTENKLKLLSVSWVAKQIDVALGDESAFFQS